MVSVLRGGEGAEFAQILAPVHRAGGPIECSLVRGHRSAEIESFSGRLWLVVVIGMNRSKAG